MPTERVCTQIYLFRENKVCLPLKKRGFGAGWHNGYGGKVEVNESLLDSAKRELLEEARVTAVDLTKQAELVFNFLRTGEKILSHVFVCNEFLGEPQETEEMKPFWFSFAEIPYKNMWPDDIYWMKKLISGEKFKAEFNFSDAKPTIKDFIIKNID